MAAEKKRIFMGLDDVVGEGAALCFGLRELGQVCDLVTLRRDPRQYEEPTDNFFTRLLRKTHDKWAQAYDEGRHKSRFFWKWSNKALLLLLFLFALGRYEVFIFLFNRTFFRSGRDLPILRFFGKKIIFLYFGSDSRPPYLNGKNLNYLASGRIEQLARLTREQKEKVIQAEKYADHIVDWIPQAYFHERDFISWSGLGIPKEVPGPLPDRPDQAQGPLKILHAPSDPVKGTELIRALLENLKNKGYDFEYLEIVNQPNAVVLERMREADLLINEIYSDSPFGALSCEAAFCGLAVIEGSLYADRIESDLRPEDRPPHVLFVRPDRIEATVEELLNDRPRLRRIGQSGPKYAETRCRRRVVGERMLRLIEGRAPESWLFSPGDIDYLYGYGLSQEQARAMVLALLEQGGVEALALGDKPELERKFLDLCAWNQRSPRHVQNL